MERYGSKPKDFLISLGNDCIDIATVAEGIQGTHLFSLPVGHEDFVNFRLDTALQIGKYRFPSSEGELFKCRFVVCFVAAIFMLPTMSDDRFSVSLLISMIGRSHKWAAGNLIKPEGFGKFL